MNTIKPVRATAVTSLVWGCLLLCPCLMSSCSSMIDTAPDTKYLGDFHEKYFAQKEDMLQDNQLSLYVDCSTCIALGLNSNFYKEAMVPSFVLAAKHYYSIEGKNIVEHDADSTYSLLRSIKEVNYADLKTAANRIADGNTEGVLVTDGEYYEPSIAAGNINNPYMAQALETWLIKGHDVYIISEPYIEPYRGKKYSKKRFYFLFTDTRMENNIWNRVSKTVNFEDYDGVDVFHLSIARPAVQVKEGMESSTPNEVLAAKVQRYGMCEIQDWPIDWSSIESLIIGALDESTGDPLPNGDKVISGLIVDKNSFSAIHIDAIDLKVYNINAAYYDFYNSCGAKTSPARSVDLQECPGFLKVDNKAFKKNGAVDVYFDVDNYNPDLVLDGSPFNYIKVDFYVKDITNIFKQCAPMFEFTSIDCQPGETNVSVAKSIEQCLVDPAVQNHIRENPFYTIYIKCNKK